MLEQSDALSDVLGAMRVSGQLVLAHRYGTPWAVAIPSSQALASLTAQPATTRVVAFHLVLRGRLSVSIKRRAQVVRAGQIVVCFGGAAHRLRCGRAGPAIDLLDVLNGARRPPEPESPQDGTEIICGVLSLKNTALNPLMAALPDLLVAGFERGHLEPFVRLLRAELDAHSPGQSFVMARVLEVLCGGLVRAHLEGLPREEIGFLGALRDHQIRTAVEHIHAEPSRGWTLEALAQVAFLSRSRFAARFLSVVGLSPMRYLMQWRMNIAMRALGYSDASVEQVALQVGYESLPAFSRAFSRCVGVSPSAYRREAARC